MEAEKKYSILSDESHRDSLYPIQYHNLWNMYKDTTKDFWVADKIDMSKDIESWKQLKNESVKHFILKVLAFFACSDLIVNENLLERFLHDVKPPEIKFFYVYQMAIENIHTETYQMMIDTLLGNDQDKKTELMKAVSNDPTISSKADWAKEYIKADSKFATRLIAFACVEGIFFCSSFAAIFWLNHRIIDGVPLYMEGLHQSNEYIRLDEQKHYTFACAVYNELFPDEKLTNEEIYDIVDKAVECESKFVRDALYKDLPMMNQLLMIDRVKFVADDLLQLIGLPRLYKVANPFPMMEGILLEQKTNMFEHRITQYRLMGSSDGYMIMKQGRDGPTMDIDAMVGSWPGL